MRVNLRELHIDADPHPEPPSGLVGRPFEVDQSLGGKHVDACCVLARRCERVGDIGYERIRARAALGRARNRLKSVRTAPDTQRVPFRHLDAVAMRRHFTEGPGIPGSLFPQLPVAEATKESASAYEFYRALMEYIGLDDEDDLSYRHELLSRLDSVPPFGKEHFSLMILDRLADATRPNWRRGFRRPKGVTPGRLRISDGFPQLVYVVSTLAMDSTLDPLRFFLMFEHHKFARVDGFPDSAVSIGVAICPARTGPQPWSAAVAMLKGDPEIPEPLMAALTDAFGPYWDDDARTGLQT